MTVARGGGGHYLTRKKLTTQQEAIANLIYLLFLLTHFFSMSIMALKTEQMRLREGRLKKNNNFYSEMIDLVPISFHFFLLFFFFQMYPQISKINFTLKFKSVIKLLRENKNCLQKKIRSKEK